ncbi:hypothetical protein B0H14DRAFT_2630524 [Mycena olivaceomarginata]|nr:hypothetical protein B0H14DRAFT_2630524 [Mycena olivaceomarginata]
MSFSTVVNSCPPLAMPTKTRSRTRLSEQLTHYSPSPMSSPRRRTRTSSRNRGSVFRWLIPPYSSNGADSDNGTGSDFVPEEKTTSPDSDEEFPSSLPIPPAGGEMDVDEDSTPPRKPRPSASSSSHGKASPTKSLKSVHRARSPEAAASSRPPTPNNSIVLDLQERPLPDWAIPDHVPDFVIRRHPSSHRPPRLPEAGNESLTFAEYQAVSDRNMKLRAQHDAEEMARFRQLEVENIAALKTWESQATEYRCNLPIVRARQVEAIASYQADRKRIIDRIERQGNTVGEYAYFLAKHALSESGSGRGVSSHVAAASGEPVPLITVPSKRGLTEIDDVELPPITAFSEGDMDSGKEWPSEVSRVGAPGKGKAKATSSTSDREFREGSVANVSRIAPGTALSLPNLSRRTWGLFWVWGRPVRDLARVMGNERRERTAACIEYQGDKSRNYATTERNRNHPISCTAENLEDRNGVSGECIVEVLQRFSLSGELFTQPPGNPGDCVEGDGRVGGQPNISPTGDGKPFVGVVEGGRGAQRCGGDDGVETAGEPRRRRMEEVDVGAVDSVATADVSPVRAASPAVSGDEEEAAAVAAVAASGRCEGQR